MWDLTLSIGISTDTDTDVDTVRHNNSAAETNINKMIVRSVDAAQ